MDKIPKRLSRKGKTSGLKKFCPACGSTHIKKSQRGYVCMNCGAIFSKPRETVVKLRKSPRYIG